MHHYLEFVDEKSSKFWEVTVAGDTMTTRWGRIGAAGQTKQQAFDSAEAALAAAEKLRAEKVKKGYRAAADEAADAKADAPPAAEPGGSEAAAEVPASAPAAKRHGAADAKALTALDQVWDRIEAKYAALGASGLLRAGATEVEITEAEQALGLEFPVTLRASLARHNGSELGGWPAGDLLGTSEIVGEVNIWRELLTGGDFDDLADYQEDERLQPGWWHSGWVCIDADGGGNGHAIDLNPAGPGKVGQVLFMDHEVGPDTVAYPDFVSYLKDHLRELKYATFDGEYFEVSEPDGEPEVTYLEYVAEKSSKFWEITVEGETVTTRWGRIGAQGQSKEQEFDSEDDAAAAAEKLIDEKLGKGYEEAEPPEPDA